MARKIGIWTYQAVESKQGWLINGVIVSGFPKAITPSDGALRIFTKTIGSYFHKSRNQVKIVAELNGKRHLLETDRDGSFQLEAGAAQIKSLVFYDSNNAELPLLNQGQRHYHDRCAQTMVISDIDDTILVSHSARFFSKLWLMLFKPLRKRRAVEESEKAYLTLKNANIPFAYVSASEYNLYALIYGFLKLGQLPEGQIYLRPYQAWQELLFPRKRKDYKLEKIKMLFQHFKTQHFVLFGDDSQHDFTVFGELAKIYPERIHSVYLRKTGFLKGSAADRIWQLPDASIPVHYYNSYTEISTHIHELINENPSYL